MTEQALSWQGVILAISLILGVGIAATRMGLNLTRSLTIATLRMAGQLILVGLVLKTLFEVDDPWWLIPVSLFMIGVAGFEIRRRQRYTFSGSFWLGTVTLILSSLTITLIALLGIFDLPRWFEPRFSIPLLGMLLGHVMTGVGLSLDQLTDSLVQSRQQIEGRLVLGQSFHQATLEVRRQCVRRGMIPVINALSVAGLVSLPGIMSGQILAGVDPMTAVRYQVLLFLLLSSASGAGIMMAVQLGCRYFSDDRQRLRLDRLKRQL